MKRIAGTMGVSRTHQYEKRMHNRQGGKRFYHKAQDEQYLPLIRKIVDDRATYGYRRVTALLKRQLGKETVNHKRVYRLYRAAGLGVRRRQRKRIGVVERQALAIPWTGTSPQFALTLS